MTEGTFTLGLNPDGRLIFVRVKAGQVEICCKAAVAQDDATIRLRPEQVADLIEVLK